MADVDIARVITLELGKKLLATIPLGRMGSRKLLYRLMGFAFQSIRHFIDCVMEDKEPLSSGKDGLEVTKIICGLEESILSGSPVQIR